MIQPAPTRRWDLLRLPLVRRFVRWRYSRFVLQLPLFLLALLALFDGFTGRQLAPKNLATVSVWLHYRGLVVLAIALLGNVFCAACPLMLTRGASRALKRWLPQQRWPRWLRNKYGVLGLTLLYLFAYEYWDLWASPWLTAWLILGYFGAALVVDAIFPSGTFCKYVCPLGNFNFALSTASPTQITARDPARCLTCEGKYCVNGRGAAYPGCETRLFVPQIQSNTDCTLCLNCVRACPYDNVALEVRSPVREWVTARYRPDWALFGALLLFAGVMNAFAMVPAYYALAEALARALGTTHEGVLLGVIFAAWVGIAGLLSVGLSLLSSWLAGIHERPLQAVRRWGAGYLPMAFAVWGAHYAYHFLTGWASIVPVTQQALGRLGLYPGRPDWALAAQVPEALLFPVAALAIYAGLAASSYVLVRRSLALGRGYAALPVLALLVYLAALTLWVLAQPMEMRGTLLAPSPSGGI